MTRFGHDQVQLAGPPDASRRSDDANISQWIRLGWIRLGWIRLGFARRTLTPKPFVGQVRRTPEPTFADRCNGDLSRFTFNASIVMEEAEAEIWARG